MPCPNCNDIDSSYISVCNKCGAERGITVAGYPGFNFKNIIVLACSLLAIIGCILPWFTDFETDPKLLLGITNPYSSIIIVPNVIIILSIILNSFDKLKFHRLWILLTATISFVAVMIIMLFADDSLGSGLPVIALACFIMFVLGADCCTE